MATVRGNPIITPPKCDLCGAYLHKGSAMRHGLTIADMTHGISVPCPKMTKAEALATAAMYHQSWLMLREELDKLRYDVIRNERIKFNEVCHENNKLRSKLYPPKKKRTSIKSKRKT